MSHVMPVQLAIIAVMNARSSWVSMVGSNKVYSGSVAEGTSKPYVVLGSVSERDAAVFASTGFDQVKLIDLWSGALGKELCAAMYADMHVALNNQPLLLAGGRIVLGKLTLVSMFTDPDEPTEHGVATYRVATRV